jgi:hypothetical protein
MTFIRAFYSAVLIFRGLILIIRPLPSPWPTPLSWKICPRERPLASPFSLGGLSVTVGCVRAPVGGQQGLRTDQRLPKRFLIRSDLNGQGLQPIQSFQKTSISPFLQSRLDYILSSKIMGVVSAVAIT